MNAPAKATHTPGPYTVTRSKYPQDGEYDFAVSAQIDGKLYCLAEVFGRVAPDIRPNAEALATLFAAAPEMLDALKGLTHGLPELLKSIGYTDEENLIGKALAVIAKAESAQ